MLSVDYGFYSQIFHGKVEQSDFERLGIYAAAYLDEATMGRASEELPGPVLDKVRLAYCALVDAYDLEEHGGGIASETNDGISVTYVSGIGGSNANKRRLYSAVSTFLGSTGLLYRGVQ